MHIPLPSEIHLVVRYTVVIKIASVRVRLPMCGKIIELVLIDEHLSRGVYSVHQHVITVGVEI